jgi:hypothetical protein
LRIEFRQTVTAETHFKKNLVGRCRYVRQKFLVLVPSHCVASAYIVANHIAALHDEFHVLHL